MKDHSKFETKYLKIDKIEDANIERKIHAQFGYST